MPGHNALYVGRHRHMASMAYVSPYLLEILNSSVGFSSQVATGTLTANTGQTVSCSRAASGYCLGNDGLLHLLGANTVRVEPSGLLVEGAATNNTLHSQLIGGTDWLAVASGASPTAVTNSTDVLDPAGGNTASKLTYPAVGAASYAIWQGTGVAAANTTSVYLRTLSGTATVYLMFNGSAASVACNVTSTWQRFSAPGAASFGSIWLGFDTRPANSNTATTAGCTVYAWGAQVEGLPFATSYIPTTTAAASRDADIVSLATNPLPSLGPYTCKGTFTPLFSAWSASPYNPIISIGSSNINGVRFGFDSIGRSDLDVWDSTGAQGGWIGTIPSVAKHSLVASTPNDGTLTTFNLDGSPITPTPFGTSTRILTANTAPVRFGTDFFNNTTAGGHMTDIVLDNK